MYLRVELMSIYTYSEHLLKGKTLLLTKVFAGKVLFQIIFLMFQDPGVVAESPHSEPICPGLKP